MDLKPRRRSRLLVGAAAAVIIPWLVLLATGILSPQPDTAPVALAEEASPTPTPLATVAPSATPTPESASPAPDAGESTGTAATRIRIEELGIDLPVYEGDGYTAELGKAAHFPTTAWPGAGSMIYLYAHAQDQNFVALWEAELGDIIELELEDGSTARYEISRIVPDVRWDDLSWLEPTPTEILRLQTCNSDQNTDPRFIVDAVRIVTG